MGYIIVPIIPLPLYFYYCPTRLRTAEHRTANQRTDETQPLGKWNIIPMVKQVRKKRVDTVLYPLIFLLLADWLIEVFFQFSYFFLKSCTRLGKSNFHLRCFGNVGIL